MTNLKGLYNFKSKVDGLKKIGNGELAKAMCERGLEIAQGYYSGSKMPTLEVIGSGNSYSLVASAKGLLYTEYGTGRVGQSSGYPTDRLPNGGIPITGGWEYYYDSPHKATLNGVEGWWVNLNSSKRFSTGREAGMQMYNTSEDLRAEKHDIILNYLKGVK